MGNHPVKAINTECPICYENLKSNKIILSCSHAFNLYCIQKTSEKFIKDNTEVSCPICRKKISKKDLKEIFKEWNILNYHPDEYFYEKKLFFMDDNLIIKKTNLINLSNKSDIFAVENLLVSLNKTIYVPPFIISPPIDILYYETLNYDLASKITSCSNDDEIFGGFNFVLSAKFENSLSYYNFLNRTFDVEKFKNYEFYNDFINSKTHIRFWIRDLSKINIVNSLDGTSEFGLKILPKRNICLFKSYLFYDSNNIYIINELFGINYLDS
tara:strand:+ start:282 stop:1091 length:810 start_codon:yes stop_codon:yes gene_type:complete